jgi:hypothetical protein
VRSRPDPFDRPLDALLERIRWHGLDHTGDPEAIDAWVAPCPVCGCGRPALRFVERYVGGPVSITCVSGCHETRIVAALAAAPETST